MGLSALSSHIRRRLAARSKPILKSKTSSKDPAPPNLTRRTLKRLTPQSLLQLLHQLPSALTKEQVAAVADLVATNPPFLEAFVATLVAPPATNVAAPRSRLPHSWLVSTLLRFGPPQLRQALSKRPDLISDIAAVFSAKPSSLDPALATHAADVLRIMLHDYPRQTALALHKTSLPHDLVRHIDLQPAADFLPRLVSHRIFSPSMHAPLIPMHKRAIVMLGAAHVQQLLADAFVTAASQFPNASPTSRMELVPVLSNSAATMAELSIRAMCLERKHEDADERFDVAFATNLGIVSSHVFNDAAREMTLIETPGPLQSVLDAGLNQKKERHVLLPMLSLITSVLKAVGEAKRSALPSVRRVVRMLDLTDVGKILVGSSIKLGMLLNDQGDASGRRRIAVMDLMRECCEELPENCVEELLLNNDHNLLNRIMEAASTHAQNDLLQVRVAQMLHAIFTKCPSLSTSMLSQTSLIDFMLKKQEVAVMDWPLGALAAYVSRVRDEVRYGHEQEEKLQQLLDDYFERRREVEEEKSAFRLRSTLAKISTDLITDVNLEDQLIANEDYGQELYLHHLLDEVSGGDNQTPPSDSHISQASASFSKKWGKGLSERLKEVHSYIHQEDDSSDTN